MIKLILALLSNSKSRFLIALSKIVILPYSLLLQLERSHYFYAVVKDLLNTFNELFGGDERNRTADPLLARQVLSQLSYTPIPANRQKWWAWMDSNHRPHAYQACALTT